MCDSSKRCRACGVEKAATAEFFYTKKASRDGLTASCRDCTNAAQRARYVKKGTRLPRLNAEGLLRCCKCKEYKPFDGFAKSEQGPYKRRGWCRECEAVRYQERRVPAESRLLTSQGLRRCGICKQVFPATAEYFRRQGGAKSHCSGLYPHCKACHAERTRDYNRVAAHRRRELIRLTPAAEAFTIEDVKRQLEGQKGKCYWCRKPLGSDYHIDHLIPVSRGGDNTPGNIVCACPFCNVSRNNKLPHEWTGRLL